MVGGASSGTPSWLSGSRESPSENNAFDFAVGSPQAGRERAETTRLADLHSARLVQSHTFTKRVSEMPLCG